MQGKILVEVKLQIRSLCHESALDVCDICQARVNVFASRYGKSAKIYWCDIPDAR